MGREFQKAEVEGVEFREEENGDKLLIEVMEQTKAVYQMVDAELTSEIVNTLRGHFSPDLIYNKPVFSPNSPTHHRACDRMKGGKCSYAGQPHEHILGVGIKGAEEAFRAYGKLKISVPEMPVIVEQGDKLYWAVKVTGVDGHNDNQTEKWYLESVLLKTKKGYIEKEHGALICQSKAQRNVILALIPNEVMRLWIEDYLDGKEPFQKYELNNSSQPPKKGPAKPQPAKEEKPKKEDQDVKDLLDRFGKESQIDPEIITEFFRAGSKTLANVKLRLTRALSDNDEADKLKAEINAYIDSKLAEEAEKAAEKEQDPGEPQQQDIPM